MISANLTGYVILFEACLTVLQGLRGRWAGSQPKQQPELLPLQRSLSKEPFQVVIQEMEPTSVLQPTPLQEPVAANLGFLNGASTKGTRNEVPQAPRGYREGAASLQNFFLILGLEIAYSDAT